MTQGLIIRTSQAGWLAILARAYKEHSPVLVIDDANVGIDPETDSLFEMARRAELTTAEIAAVCIACGMAVAGVGLVILAFVDPEPTSKLGLLIGGGVLLALTGGGSAIYILTKKRPPNIKVSPQGGFEITWT